MAEALVNKAKLAEQAERYEDMAKVGVKRRNILSMEARHRRRRVCLPARRYYVNCTKVKCLKMCTKLVLLDVTR